MELDYDVDIEDKIYLTHVPNPRSKWDQKLIEVVGNNVGDPIDRRRTRSQFQDENLALSYTDPLLLERCYMMLGSDPQSYKEAYHDLIWQASMDDQYNYLQDKNTWELTSLPPGRKLVQ